MTASTAGAQHVLSSGSGYPLSHKRDHPCCLAGSWKIGFRDGRGLPRRCVREGGILSGTARAALPRGGGPCRAAGGWVFAVGRLAILPSASAAASPSTLHHSVLSVQLSGPERLSLRRVKPSRTRGGAHCPAPSALAPSSQPIPRREIPPLAWSHHLHPYMSNLASRWF